MRRGFCFVRAKSEKKKTKQKTKRKAQTTQNRKDGKTKTNPAAAGFVLCRSENRPNADSRTATPRSTAECPALRKGRMRMTAQTVRREHLRTGTPPAQPQHSHPDSDAWLRCWKSGLTYPAALSNWSSRGEIMFLRNCIPLLASVLRCFCRKHWPKEKRKILPRSLL